MKKHLQKLFVVPALPVLLLTLNLQLSTARAQGTAFTYQGQLQDNGAPANGTYDLKFELLPTGSGLASAIATVTNSAVGVTNGLFTVTLDFGANFPGADRWLDIFVRTNGAAAFTGLTPRQQLTPAPYAITAATAITADSANNLTGLIVQQNADGAPNVVLGSSGNYVSGGVEGATIGGGGATNYPNTNSVTADFGTVAGGAANTASGYSATVGGGAANTASGYSATVGGGAANTASGYATVAGGVVNTASGIEATVGGGDGNTANGFNSTVSGGNANTASGNEATVSGGDGNTASGNEATVSGGEVNHATNNYATVPGGDNNLAGGQYSFAAGQQAQATNDGTFVWADSQNATFSSTSSNQFLIRAQGGVGIDTGTTVAGSLTVNTNTYLDDHPIYLRGLSGADLNHGLGYNGQTTTNFGTGQYQIDGPALWGYSGGLLGTRNGGDHAALQWNTTSVTVNGTFNNLSDRNAKQNFAAITPAQILDKVTQLPLSEWSYKMDAATRHIGPMAQDFYSTFNVGTDDRHIAPIDENGVALAAIQGLNQKLQEELNRQDAENANLKQQNDLLAERLNKLAATVKSLAQTK